LAGLRLALGTVFVFALFATLPRPPAQAQTVLAIFPPWWTQQQAIAAASAVGHIVGTEARAWTIIVHSDDPAIAQKLNHAGAWLLLDPHKPTLCNDLTAAKQRR
jgi:hypothetical protein